jgi:predicted RNA-binding protein with PIN domain
MGWDWIIVDGYSLIYQDPGLASHMPGRLEQARLLLIRRLEQAAGDLAERVTVVFDGGPRGAGEVFESPVLEVQYAPGRLTADTVIERLVHQAADPDRVAVVTADRAERETVTSAGAHAISCRQFLDRLARPPASSRAAARAAPPWRPTLGDLFP